MNKTIVITGSTGFVGQNLSPYLNERGYAIIPLDLRKPLPATIPEGASAIIHLAGKAHDHAGTASPEDYFNINTELTWVVFEQFLKSDCKLFIHFSSVAAITDEQVEGVLQEDAVPHPVTPYGQSKLQAEQLIQQVLLPADKKVFIIRPAMIHGPGDKGNLTLLYRIVSKGIPYPLAAYNNQRSFLSIENLNYAIERLLQQADNIPSGIYNLVDDEPVSTMDIVRLIAGVTGRKGKLMAVPKPFVKLIARMGDLLPLPLNTKRLAKLTGNYIVSNQKIKKALGIDRLPIPAQEGLERTIRSFASK